MKLAVHSDIFNQFPELKLGVLPAGAKPTLPLELNQKSINLRLKAFAAELSKPNL